MFKGREQARPATNGGGLNSVLGDGSQMSGIVKVEGSIRLDGEFEGQLLASDSVFVGRTGTARAELEAREIVVAGEVEGKLTARERVELQSGARVTGDVFAQNFVIAEGVTFNGSCRMGESAKPIRADSSVEPPPVAEKDREVEDSPSLAVFKAAGSGPR
jgi:cytoskeletal protein CcmA (bactofilin family)